MTKIKKFGFESGKIYDEVHVTFWEDEVYPYTFWVLISQDMEKVDKGLKLMSKITEQDELKGDDGTKAMCSEWQDPDGKKHIIFNFRENASMGNLAHEIVHGVNWVFQYVGIKLDPNNDEPQAYMTGYLMRKLMDAFIDLEKKTIKLKDKCRKPKKVHN